MNLIIVPHFNHVLKKKYETKKNKKKLFSPIFYYRSIKNVYIHPKPKKKDNYFVAFYDCIMKKKNSKNGKTCLAFKWLPWQRLGPNTFNDDQI